MVHRRFRARVLACAGACVLGLCAALYAQADSTLFRAVERNDLAAIDKLLKSGMDARGANRYGLTPLHLAATNGSVPAIERLIAAGADPNAALPDGETVLMTAARTGRPDALKALLARGARVDAKDRLKGQTALMWAAAEGNADAIRVLVAAGASVAERSKSGVFSPLLFAVRGGHSAAVNTLLELGANVNDAMPDGTSALIVAVINAHYETAGLLLDKGADPTADAQGWTALHQIAWSRRHNFGFNLPGPVQTGSLDSLELARRLVEKGTNIDARLKKEPRDGNRNLLNRIGATAYLMAAKNDDVPLMKVLLELGADPSIKTELGATALMVAAGVGIWAPGENPGTPEEALAAVKVAYEAGGSDINAVDSNGDTALHGAVYRGGNIAAIEYLVEKGARMDIRNKKGMLPVEVADGEEHTPAVLKRYPEAAAVLRKLMRAKGLPVPDSAQPGVAAGTVPGGLSDPRRPGLAEQPRQAQDSRPGLAQQPRQDAAAPARTLRDGVYSEAQAARGELNYRSSCGRCHSDDLMGDRDAPALVGAAFTSRWGGQTVEDLYQSVKRTMPQEAPDTLGPAAYADIVSYIIKSNGHPAGASDLPLDALKQVGIPK